jgi:Zn-finger nucleic acid-binding protein
MVSPEYDGRSESVRRIVACTSCHTQYDVTEVTDEKLVCRCGAMVENRTPEGIDAAVHRCGSCGAQVEDGAESCAYCASNIVRESWKLSLICPECAARNDEASRFCTGCGVGFDPEAACEDALEYPCPVCSCLMPARMLGAIGINECPQCNGLWVPENRFNQLVNSAIDSRRNADPELRAAFDARVKGGNPARQKVSYRKCPVCEAFMQRRNFRKSSGVILDRCSDHGTFLDADELEQIVGFVLSGGRPESTARLENVQDEARRAYVSARVSAVTQKAGARSHARYSDSKGGLGTSLLGVLKILLD